MIDYLRTAVISAMLFFGQFILSPGHAAEPAPIIVRSAIGNAKADIWVGQRAVLQVDVLARDGWAQIKTARDFEVPGAYVVRLESQGTRLNETISGHDYGGQRYEMSLFAQQGGTITVPPIPIDVEVRRWGSEAETTSQHMKTPAAEFEVKIPPGAENRKGIISTTELKAQQQWTPPSQEFKVGDAVKRIIELSAPDISGMAFAPSEFPTISGLGIYPGESDVADSYSRGSLTGKRTETVTYVFEKEGSFELPQIVVPWWDISQKKLKEVVLPALVVKITAVPGSDPETFAEKTLEDGRQRKTEGLLPVVFLLLLLAGSAWRFRHAMRTRWQTWRRERRQSEKAYFTRLREACRNNDSKTAYNRMVAWLNKTASDPGAATLKNFLEAVGSEKLSKEVGELERRLYQKTAGRDAQTPWQGEALYRELAYWRNKDMRTKETTLPGEATLAPLNPQ